MLLAFCLLFLLIAGILRKVSKGSRNTLPKLPHIPILGSIPFLPKEFRREGKLHIPKLFHHLALTHGKIFQLHLGPLKTVVISDAELLRKVFKLESVSHRPSLKPFHKFRYGSPDGSQRGVILSSGQEWKEQRMFCLRELSRLGFGRSSMEGALLEEINKLIEDLSKDEGKPMELNFRMNIPIVNAFWAIVSGERLELGDERAKGLARSVDKVMRNAEVASLWALLSPTTFSWLSPRFRRGQEAFEGIRKLVIPMIERHEASFDENNLRDFTDVYLKEIKNGFGDSFNHQSLDTVLIDLFLGGSETTAISLIWAFLYLLKFPRVQRKVHEELDRVIGPWRNLTLEDRGSLPYLNALIQETMRKSSIVPMGVPHYVTENVALNDSGMILEKGTQVFGNIIHVHHDSSYWEDPEVFRPERFIDSQGEFVSHSHKCIPFSVGKRYCLGKSLAEKELYLFMANLLHRFRLSSRDEVLPNTDFISDEENKAFIRYAPIYSVILQNRFNHTA